MLVYADRHVHVSASVTFHSLFVQHSAPVCDGEGAATCDLVH